MYIVILKFTYPDIEGNMVTNKLEPIGTFNTIEDARNYFTAKKADLLKMVRTNYPNTSYKKFQFGYEVIKLNPPTVDILKIL